MRDFVGVNIIFPFDRGANSGHGVDQHQLYLHALGQDTFNVYACHIAHLHAGFALCKSGEIGGKLHENAIVLDTAYDA